jgi:hypothetical protein
MPGLRRFQGGFRQGSLKPPSDPDPGGCPLFSASQVKAEGIAFWVSSIPASGAFFPDSSADDFRSDPPLPAVAISVLMLRILPGE